MSPVCGLRRLHWIPAWTSQRNLCCPHQTPTVRAGSWLKGLVTHLSIASKALPALCSSELPGAQRVLTLGDTRLWGLMSVPATSGPMSADQKPA